MKTLRYALVVLALLGSLGLVSAPATAAGKNCASTRLAQWCAEITGRNTSVSGDLIIYAQRDRVRVRVARISLQRRAANGDWRVVNAYPVSVYWARGSYGATADILCAEAPGGHYRVTGVLKWKLGGHGEVHTRRITSDPVRKSRVCD